MITSEQKTQTAILEWLALQHPVVHEHVIKIDNEGKRSVAGHVLAKRMGLHKGASDLFIAWPTLQHFGLFIEVKPDGWKGPSGRAMKEHHERQLNFIAKMNLRGYFAKMIIGVDEGIDIIDRYIKQKL